MYCRFPRNITVQFRVAEINKSTNIAPDFDLSSRRAKGSVFVIRDFWRNAEDGPKEKQDCGFIYFRGPYLLHVVQDLNKWGKLYVPHPSIDKFQKEANEVAKKAMDTVCENQLQSCPNFQKRSFPEMLQMKF
ncbi:MAG: hypothetical protein HGJ94_02070 [Desulfosarcina sp.]|nr:hypothetical protein [Desulfosarcina sp.]